MVADVNFMAGNMSEKVTYIYGFKWLMEMLELSLIDYECTDNILMVGC